MNDFFNSLVSSEKQGENDPRNTKSRKLITMALSLIAALVLWGYVIGEVNPSMTVTLENIPVELENRDVLEKKGLAIEGGGNFTVTVTAKGSRSEVNKLKAGDIIASADLASVGRGKNYLDITVSLPSSLELSELTPGQIFVNIEDFVEVSMPVDVVFLGETEEDTEVGNVKTQPEAVFVSGARSDVEAVKSVCMELEAKEFGPDGASKTRNLAAKNSSGKVVSAVALSKKKAKVFAVLLPVKEVDLVIPQGEMAQDRGVVSVDAVKKIKIKGKSETLAGITSIQTEPLALERVKDAQEMKLVLDLPDGVEVTDAFRDLKATVSIEEYTTKIISFAGNEISMKNQMVGTSAAVSASEVKVKVSGTKKQLQKITKADISITADLQNASAGSVQAELAAFVNGDVHTITIEPSVLTVTISGVE